MRVENEKSSRSLRKARLPQVHGRDFRPRLAVAQLGWLNYFAAAVQQQPPANSTH